MNPVRSSNPQEPGIALGRQAGRVVDLRGEPCEASVQNSWRAHLDLELACRAGRTVVVRNAHEGPLRIQKPFYPGDGSTHLYILHPPSGLAGGDRLVLDVRALSDAHVLLTTPASTKFYRSIAAESELTQNLYASSGSVIEWLPAETILFGGSRAVIRTRVVLDAGARFIGWEGLALGRPLSGDNYAAGTSAQQFELVRNGKPLLLERMRWAAGDDVLKCAWGLSGFGVWGAMYFMPSTADGLQIAQQLCSRFGPGRAAATLIGDLLVIRILTEGIEKLRQIFEACWTSLRELTIGIPPLAPRIWTT